MRWLVDECVSPEIARMLRGLGHDVVHVLESYRAASDEFVFELAAREQRVLVTEDNGFGEGIFRRASGSAIPAVIQMRIPSERVVLKAERLRDVVVLHGEHLLGHFVTVGENRTRLRPLPR